MAEPSALDSRRVVAEHNLKAILDAAEQLLSRGEQPTIKAVAAEAGVSRPTVYAHFPDRQALIEGLVERTVRDAMTAIASANVEQGPAADALERVLEASWEQLASHDQIAHAAASDLSADAMRAAHQSARDVIGELIERGRREGSFRTDLRTSWLVTAALALIHATAEEVRNGQLNRDAALETLNVAIPELFGSR